MNSQRFDEITRGLASATSRRGLLKGVAGGGVLAAIGRSGASARAATSCTTGDSGIVYAIILAVANILRSIGIPFPLPTPPGPIECEPGRELNSETCECDCILTEADCPGQAVVDRATCACTCPLTTSDCPGGVELEACACVPIVCNQAQADCGAVGLNCSCAYDEDADELVCVDHDSVTGYSCETYNDCPTGMVCASDDGCSTSYCYPVCGQASAFRHLPNRLV